jgi:hypothetical protein
MSYKKNLHKKMMAGLSAGILLTHISLHASDAKDFPNLMQLAAETGGNITYRLMTKDEIMLELTNDGAKQFEALSPEGQQLALKIASRSCDGTNDCKGQNACRTKDNDCAGKGKCKGTTKCAISDKSLAVRLASQIMAEKRQTLNGNNQDSSTPNTNAKDSKTTLQGK